MLPSWLPDFRVCAWRSVSLDAVSMAALSRQVDSDHPGEAIIRSCQRLEAYGFDPCTCGAPVRLTGRAALGRLAAIAAGLDSVLLGEVQIVGQVRAAFRDARGPLRAAADLALAAAREAREALPAQRHAGHLLDRALSIASAPRNGRLLVLGTGALGRLIASRGAELGFQVTMAGRRDPGSGFPFVPLAEAPRTSADVVAGCLGSGAGAVDPRVFTPARLFIDLGTPRNFRDSPGATVVTLAQMLDDEAQRPHAAALRARLREAVEAALDRRLNSVTEDARHPIGRFRLAAEQARRAALERALARHPGADRDTVDRALRTAVNRFLHRVTVELRCPGNLNLAECLADAMDDASPLPTGRIQPEPAGIAGTRS